MKNEISKKEVDRYIGLIDKERNAEFEKEVEEFQKKYKLTKKELRKIIQYAYDHYPDLEDAYAKFKSN